MADFQYAGPQRGAPPHRHAGDDSSVAESESCRSSLSDNGGNDIITYAPKERFRLGYFDVGCLVINRMIGTGIFMSPQRVMVGTGSTGTALLFWAAGMIYCMCGVHVYIEYGLNVPRYIINGIEQSVPRSGGDLNYLSYVYNKPAYRKNTILLSTCIFGIVFIVFGNMAGNCMIFAHRVLWAANLQEPSNAAVRGVALAVATFSCFIHTVSRRGGIWLNNVLAMIKIGILFLIVVVTICVAAGRLPDTPNVVEDNTALSKSFANGSNEANGYAQAFLAIIFSFSGFEQPNYVLGEISRPRKKFPIAMSAGVGIVITLYLVVNICYMVVVPKESQISGEGSVAEQFFVLTLGQLEGGKELGLRIFNAMLAVSSLGNIIVMTYTAARVKQEIAKEGILPYPKFFSKNTDISIGRLLRWVQRRGWFTTLLSLKWFSPEQHSEATPVGAIMLHFTGCAILIFATYSLKPVEAYTLLTSWSAYTINAFMAMWLGLGILILRARGPPAADVPEDPASISAEKATAKKKWSDMTGKGINPTVSFIAALVYCLGGLYPVITTWVPPSKSYRNQIRATTDWWLVPVFSWCIIGLGVAWFLGFVTVAKRIERKDHRVFVVERRPEFEPAGGSSNDSETTHVHDDPRSGGGLVQVHETVFLSWVGRETLRLRSSAAVRESPMPPFQATQPDKPTAYMSTAHEVPTFGAPADGYYMDPRQQAAYSHSTQQNQQAQQAQQTWQMQQTQQFQEDQQPHYVQHSQYGWQEQYGQQSPVERQPQYVQPIQQPQQAWHVPHDHQENYEQQSRYGQPHQSGYEEQPQHQGTYGTHGLGGHGRPMY